MKTNPKLPSWVTLAFLDLVWGLNKEPVWLIVTVSAEISKVVFLIDTILLAPAKTFAERCSRIKSYHRQVFYCLKPNEDQKKGWTQEAHFCLLSWCLCTRFKKVEVGLKMICDLFVGNFLVVVGLETTVWISCFLTALPTGVVCFSYLITLELPYLKKKFRSSASVKGGAFLARVKYYLLQLLFFLNYRYTGTAEAFWVISSRSSFLQTMLIFCTVATSSH